MAQKIVQLYPFADTSKTNGEYTALDAYLKEGWVIKSMVTAGCAYGCPCIVVILLQKEEPKSIKPKAKKVVKE